MAACTHTHTQFCIFPRLCWTPEPGAAAAGWRGAGRPAPCRGTGQDPPGQPPPIPPADGAGAASAPARPSPWGRPARSRGGPGSPREEPPPREPPAELSSARPPRSRVATRAAPASPLPRPAPPRSLFLRLFFLFPSFSFYFFLIPAEARRPEPVGPGTAARSAGRGGRRTGASVPRCPRPLKASQ